MELNFVENVYLDREQRMLFEELFRLSNLKPRKRDFEVDGAKIVNVICNNPATIVQWSDDTKTVVKCQKGDTYSPETGLAMCIVKKLCKNKGNYNDIFTKWINA